MKTWSTLKCEQEENRQINLFWTSPLGVKEAVELGSKLNTDIVIIDREWCVYLRVDPDPPTPQGDLGTQVDPKQRKTDSTKIPN